MPKEKMISLKWLEEYCKDLKNSHRNGVLFSICQNQTSLERCEKYEDCVICILDDLLSAARTQAKKEMVK